MAELVKTNKMFGGLVKRYAHQSTQLGCKMHFSLFTPPAATNGNKVPVVYFLSGLTCTDENFTQKSGAQRKAAELGLALVAPDTSPRGLGIEGEDESWDFGTGAGFYLDATVDKWRQYRMYSYITEELPALLRSLPELDVDNASIMGHSMGGHGALVIGLTKPTYKSISAFAPICNPSVVPWGQKAFEGYLGEGWQEAGKRYDATELVRQYNGPVLPVLMDTGTDDDFLEKQLHPWTFEKAASGKLEVENRMQPQYDHSYYTIATFIDDHLAFHAKHLTSS
ncbi:hypothetical protein D9Q98_000455 [Chlorella vulgaris]|uniref:S-formylglutathione hydrolase n=1 Tax=Chlorella vulgaris TaxID=3077 RepID=A0A9D4TYD0_CHLVU|nr:hypothetical protein D9Q98_000455 [Chlorella vulgaris]